METLKTFETKQNFDLTEKQDPLFNILERQAKEFEEFGKRMSLELHSSHQEFIKQQNGFKLPLSSSGNSCNECKEKTVLINSLKARIEELENDSRIKNRNIKKLQKDVQYLFDIIVNKKDTTNFEKSDFEPTKIITSDTEEEPENTKQDNLSVESFQYNNDIRDSYSDSAIDLFTDDDDDTSTTGSSVKGDESGYVNRYDRPSEWLDVSSTLSQQRINRSKIDKKNLDRWNYKMANNGLLPIRLVAQVEADEEKKSKTHRKHYSTSAIWLKTYEKQNNNNVNGNEKFKIPSFNFTSYAFNNTATEDVKPKQKESKETSSPISLKSSVSTSVSELSTTSLATTSLHSYDLLEHQKNSPISKESYSKSQQILSQYK